MTEQRAFAPAPLSPGAESTVLAALQDAHEREPFLPTDARSAAHRAAELVGRVGLEARVLRGSLDLGDAELDHLFVVVGDRVVDAALPVNDDEFLTVVRAWVAGDEEAERLVRLAEELDLSARVVGLFPARLRYRGAPLWGTAA